MSTEFKEIMLNKELRSQ